MKAIALLCFVLISFGLNAQIVDLYKKPGEPARDSVLRHVVLFRFREATPGDTIRKIETAFRALPGKIPQIRDFEWGINNSPEGLDKGFTHCFFLTFSSEADRSVYLPHPDHKAFGELLGPWLEDVLVVDYWVHLNHN